MSEPQLLSLQDAIAVKSKRFFTGVPCSKGHLTERRVVGRHCVECHRLAAQRQRQRVASIPANDVGETDVGATDLRGPTLVEGWPEAELLSRLYTMKSQQVAILEESSRFFTGKLCKNGHIDLRRTTNGACVACEWQTRHGSNDRRKEYLSIAINGALRQPALPEWSLISREEARAKELPRFYIREVCKNGHIGPRYVGNNECTLCSSVRNRERYAADSEFRAHRIKYETARNRRPDVREGRLVKMREYNRRPAVRFRLLTRIKEDLLFKLRWNTKTLLRNTLRKHRHKKTSRLQTILGCTIAQFKKHIAKQFTVGMSWKNYGEWEFDHIVPLSSATTGEEVIALFHHTNVRPLWKAENRSKGQRQDFLI